MDAHCNPKPQELESSMRCNPTIQADSSHKPQRPGPITRRRQRQKLRLRKAFVGVWVCGFVGSWVVRALCFRGGEHEDHAASHNGLLSVCNTHQVSHHHPLSITATLLWLTLIPLPFMARSCSSGLQPPRLTCADDVSVAGIAFNRTSFNQQEKHNLTRSWTNCCATRLCVGFFVPMTLSGTQSGSPCRVRSA